MRKIRLRWQKGCVNGITYYMIYVVGTTIIGGKSFHITVPSSSCLFPKGIPILPNFDEDRIVSELVESGLLTLNENFELVETI